MSTQSEEIIAFTVPLLVPTANHYREPIRYIGRNGYLRLGFKVTDEAKAYRSAVAIFAQGRTVVPDDARERRKARYSVQVDVHLSKGQRIDSDNALKVAIDSLVLCGVLDSDAKVYESKAIVHKDDRRNPANPRTEYLITRLEKP